MTFDQLHRERDRAEGFGAAAEDYELHRPDFSPALYDDLARLGEGTVLDVGCGTGKVARALVGRGRAVLGVELDPRMAAVAQRDGIEVEIARFETWPDAGRRFDLVVSGNAWHWLEPTQAAAKAAKILRPGGTLVRFWSVQILDRAVVAALSPVYRDLAPEVVVQGAPPPTWDAGALMKLDPPFSAVEERRYETERTIAAEAWVAFTGTVSDHRRLPPERLLALQSAIQATLPPNVYVQSVTGAFFATRNDA